MNNQISKKMISLTGEVNSTKPNQCLVNNQISKKMLMEKLMKQLARMSKFKMMKISKLKSEYEMLFNNNYII